ncbi:MAG: hypothetical protein IPL89_09685 [Acidobacteria bacterium]|nr:hypothetical protein [Acidobacteriota bacterium]
MRNVLRYVLVVAALAALAAPVRAQQTAGQTVVVPSLPGMPNQEMKIASEPLANSEMVGPELPFTGQVIQWEEGRSITMKFEDGLTRVVPVVSNIIFPPDLRPGGMLTVFVRQTADGRYRVTGLTTAMQPPKPPPLPAPTAAPEPAPAAPTAPPVAMPEPPAPGPKGKTVVGATYITLRGTFKSIDKGTVTLVEANGTERTVKLSEKAAVAGGLKEGDKIVVRVPLQKPFDGKTADRVERPKPPKTPPPSKFSKVQTPAN